MGAGSGGSRPYAPKKPDPGELDAEALFNEYANLQRRNKWLRGVRLDLQGVPAPRGEAGHFEQDYMDQDPESGEFSMRPSVIKLFLPELRRGYEASRASPQTAHGQSTYTRRSRDLTAYARAVLRHEAAHAWQMEQNRIRGVDEFGEKPQTKPTKGRHAYINTPQHGELYNILNRRLAGSGSEPELPSIGLPPEFSSARERQPAKTAVRGLHPGWPVVGRG